ncbi:MAG: cytochrome ubiquinol oxidase subunit I [Fibromonadaceae bacterium]|jgi:cytochrome d ubiquinol oxidase subunit I|nr:cytochrome ubiquinol oxidase subunit I [Fibromonadaceae bacterium]
MEDILFLSRLQFAITTVYHFFFVPLTIGLGLFIAIWETVAYRSGNSDDERILRFWGRLFLLNFAAGVVSGIVLEFQFGMNWAEYSRFVGDVFGVPLAIETLLSFFITSTFLGLWMFGRNTLPREIHLMCIWIVVAAACMSALWILITNSFMQNPVGFVFNNGRAEMVDFLVLLLNPYFLHQFPHVIAASVCTAAFFVLGISAWKIKQNSNDSNLFERSFKFALFMGFIGVLAVALSGHFQGQSVAKLQPMKLAAMKNLKETADPASLYILPGIEIPALLSVMVHHKSSGEVKGMEELQRAFESRYGSGNYVPPVWISYLSFRVMVGSSLVMLSFVFYGIFWFVILKKKMHQKILLLITAGISLPYLANTAGWLIAETGRQPWIVYGYMPTSKAVSVGVSSTNVLFSLIAFSVIYMILAVIVFLLMRREVLRGCGDKKITGKNPAITIVD